MELVFLLFVLLGGLATCGFSVAILVIQYLQKQHLQKPNSGVARPQRFEQRPQFQGRPAPGKQ